jgi:hypothetical protein
MCPVPLHPGVKLMDELGEIRNRANFVRRLFSDQNLQNKASGTFRNMADWYASLLTRNTHCSILPHGRRTDIVVLACGGSGGSYRGNFCSQKGYQAQRNLPQLELSPQGRIDHLRHSYGSSNSALPLHNGVWGRLWLRRVYGASALPQPEPNYYVIATGYDHTYTSFLSARSNA